MGNVVPMGGTKGSLYEQVGMDGDERQCVVLVGPWRCMRDRGHGGECESEDVQGRRLPMGVAPVGAVWLTMQGIADLLTERTGRRVLRESVRKYRVRGQLPPEDRRFGRTPVWHQDTIEVWLTSRNGRGRRNDLAQQKG